MKLEKNGYLTERDKKLLVWLVALLLIAGLGFFVLRPLFNAGTQLSADITAAQAEKQEREEKVTLLGAQTTLNQTLRDKRSSLAGLFYPWMESQEIDRTLTGMALRYGLSARDLSITMPTAMQDLPAYAYSSLYSSDAVTQDAASGLYTARVTMRLEGDHDVLQRLIDDLYANETSLRITGYNWGSVDTLVQLDPAANAALEESDGLTLNMEIYLFDDATAVQAD